MPRFQGSKENGRENPGMKGKLVPGGVVGRLSYVVLEAGAVGGQVGRAGNSFVGQILFIGEEVKAACRLL